MSRIRLEREAHLIRLILSRPQARNAFDAESIREITEAFAEIAKTSDLASGQFAGARAVLITGEGPSFCAGADLAYMKSMAQYSREENQADANRLFAMFEAVRACPLPVVARVHGHVMGGALGLVACADIVLAEAGTQFAFSEVKLGIIPAVISPFVSQRMLPAYVRRYMLSGELFDAEVAWRSGLVAFVGDANECNSEEACLLRAFAAAGPEAVRSTKALLKHIQGRDPKDPLQLREHVTQAIAERRVSAEGQEGLGAFLQRREPNWRT
jgi:methylglutaconyl-CoA hydratase